MADKAKISDLFNFQKDQAAFAYRVLFFLIGLDAAILGFLFAQAILGHLQGLGFSIVVAWVLFGFCGIIGLLTMWSVFHMQGLGLSYFTASFTYADYVEIWGTILQTQNSNITWTHNLVINELSDRKDSEFLKRKQVLESAAANFEQAQNRFWIKASYPAVVWIHLGSFMASILIGVFLIAEKARESSHEAPSYPDQSHFVLTIPSDIEQELRNLIRSKTVPNFLPETSPMTIPSE